MSLYQIPKLYDLYYNPKNENALRKHYEAVFKSKSIETIHDCSIGTGNLTFVLSDMGYKVSGSDISEEMLVEGRAKAAERHLEIPFLQRDFRNLDLGMTYDLIMSTGNSLPHVNEEDLVEALMSMKAHLKPGGYLYIDLRNWDNIVESQSRFQVYPPIVKDNERTNVMLVRDFYEEHVVFNFVYTFEENQKITGKEVATVTYYPIMKERLMVLLKGLGFDHIQCFNMINHQVKAFKDMQWYSLIAQLPTE